MATRERVFGGAISSRPLFGIGDIVVLLMLGAFVYIGVSLAVGAPKVVRGPEISLAASALPYYALRSLGRMLAAYILSLVFAILYGYAAARSARAERILLPVLDILQSVPLLSFMPPLLLTLTALLPQGIAVETSAVVLIFTSQAWNLAYSFYQSKKTQPRELEEATALFRFSRWMRFQYVDMPFASVGIIWNSVLSWANGWFFLMAAEIFRLGNRDFRLPGLGAYLQTAADQGDTQALWMGVGTLVLLIILLDQLVWRPLLAFVERFKFVESTGESPAASESWFYNLLRRSVILERLNERILRPRIEAVTRPLKRAPAFVPTLDSDATPRRTLLGWLIMAGAVVLLVYLGIGAVQLLTTLSLDTYGQVIIGTVATMLRVLTAVGIGLVWTIPVGVLIGTNPGVARILQPVVQIMASVPATALFPALLLGVLNLPGGGDIAAVLLMLLGTQWYLLFNVIAGAAAIPQELHYTSAMLRMGVWRRWRTLILPTLFPYIVTGLITSTGGATNASIIAEYTEFGGSVRQVIGLGSLITGATAREDHALLLASTLAMIFVIVLFNRLTFHRMYRIAEDRYRLE